MDEDQGLELTEGNIETVLDEIRPYLVGELGCRPCALAASVSSDTVMASLHCDASCYNGQSAVSN